MPGPDPHAMWFERHEGRITASYYRYLWSGQEAHREARACSILRRMAKGDWRCRWCGDALPDWRRSDARYCRETCRKKAARWRRECRRNA